MADRTLISGAKDVAQAKGSGNLAAAKAGMEVGGFLADNLGKMIQKRNHEFNRLMEAELEAAGEMTHEEQQEIMAGAENGDVIKLQAELVALRKSKNKIKS